MDDRKRAAGQSTGPAAASLPPKPVRRESRTCFGISWFATEAEADAYASVVRERGITYNGGFFHGMPCGRDKTWDSDGLFAVTD